MKNNNIDKYIGEQKEEKLDLLERIELRELIDFTIELANDDELSEGAVQTAGWDKDSVAKFGKTIGKSPKEHGFFDACVSRMGSKVKNPEGLCASLVDTYKGTTKWRGGKNE